MAKKNNTQIIDNDILSQIPVKAAKNYIADFADSIKSDLIQVKRWKMINSDLINYLSNIKDKSLNDFLADVKKPIAENEKMDLIQKIQKYLTDNPLLTIAIKDKNKLWQIGFVVWYKKQNDKNGLVKNNKSNLSLNRFVLTNENLDLSFGTQAENPRIKISAAINAILNYQLFNSFDNQGKLLFDKPIYANDLILDDNESLKFAGQPIINRGFYDSPDFFGKSTDSSESTESTKSTESTDSTDNFMDL